MYYVPISRVGLTLLAAMSIALTAGAASVALKMGVNGNGGLQNGDANAVAATATAGVYPYSQANWNNLGRWGSGVNPVDANGTASGLTVNWDATGNWNQGGTQTDPDAIIMNRYVDSNGNTANVPKDGTPLIVRGFDGTNNNSKPWVYIQGLGTWLSSQGACSYDVVVYADGDSSSGGRIGQYWLQSATGSWESMSLGANLTPSVYIKDSANYITALNYVEVPTSSSTGAGALSGNFTVFRGVSADSFLLRADEFSGTDGTRRSPINAIQIIPQTIVAPVFPYPLPPAAQTNFTGGRTSFFVPAAGCSLSYQWKAGAIGSGVYTNLTDGGNLWGATTPTLTITNLAINQTADYVLEVSNTAGTAATTPMSLVVQHAVITGPTPAAAVLYPTTAAHFTATATGTGTLSYQWTKDNVPLTNDGRISGATNATLVVRNVSAADVGTYRIVVTSSTGSQTSLGASLTLLPTPAKGTYAESVVTNGALSYWTFDEAVGPTAFDHAGGLNGTYLANSAPATTGPQPPDLLGFDAANTGVGVNASGVIADQSWVTIPALNLNTNTVTIVAWINTAIPQQDWAGILTCRHGGTQAGFNFSGTKNELVYTWNNNTTWQYHSGLIVPTNEWCMVAMVVTPTNTTFYCGQTNASLRTAQIVLNNNSEVFAGTATIGVDDTYGSGRAFAGVIDDVAVFAKSLSPDQITALFAAGKGAGTLAPFIVKSPDPQNLYPGRTASFSVVSSGTQPLNYQWRKNGANISNGGSVSGADTATLIISNVQAADVASYDVVVSNPAGSATSGSAALTLTSPTGAAYEAAVAAAQPFAYWRLNEAAGSVNAYDYYGGHPATYGDYTRTWGQGFPAPTSPEFPGFETGNTAVEFMSTPGSWITAEPLNLNTNTVTIAAWIKPEYDQYTNSVGLVYQRQGLTVAGLCYNNTTTNHLGYNWNNSAAAYNWDPGLVIPVGAWSFAAVVVEPSRATLYLYNTNGLLAAAHTLAHPVQPFSGITYIGNDPLYPDGTRVFNGTIDEVSIWNRALSGEQIAALYTAATGTKVPPSIPLQPVSQTVYEGMNAQLSLTSAGSGPLTYQWYKGTAALTDGGNITGANTAILNITAATALNAGTYKCVVGNTLGSATSTEVTLTVLPATSRIVWSAPQAITTADATLNLAGSIVGAATFGTTEQIVNITNGSVVTTFDFKADGSVATVNGNGTATGAFTTNTTGNAAFDAVLNAYSYDGGPKTITINGLTPGRQYSVQLFALDDRDSSAGQHREQTRRALFQDPYDTNNVTATFYMSNNVYFVATFIASGATQTLIEVLPGWPDGFTDLNTGNMNALVIRDTSPVPVVQLQPVSFSRYAGYAGAFNASAYGVPPVTYRWQKKVGTAFSDLPDGGTILTPSVTPLTLAFPAVSAADVGDYRLVITNANGFAVSDVATLTLLTPAAGSSEAAIVSYGPLAYWRLDESAGSSIANDFAGGLNGTYGAAATNGVAGVPTPPFAGFGTGNLAARVAGALDTSWVSIPALNLNTNTVTFTAWVYPVGAQAGWSGILMTRDGVSAGIGYNDQSMLAYTWNGDTTWSYVSGLVIPADQWSFVAAAISPTEATLYLINASGIKSATNAIAHQVETWTGVGRIGSDPNSSPNRNFNGVVDNVAVFKRTLSYDEISNIYSAVPFVSQDVTITLETVAGELKLSWPQGTLLEATDPAGPWTTNNAASPYTVTPTDAKKFYKVIVK